MCIQVLEVIVRVLLTALAQIEGRRPVVLGGGKEGRTVLPLEIAFAWRNLDEALLSNRGLASPCLAREQIHSKNYDHTQKAFALANTN